MIRKWLQRLGTAPALDTKAAELYNEVVDLARRPDWFAQAGVADDLDGRFDMVVLALSLYLVRLERDEADERARAMSSALTSPDFCPLNSWHAMQLSPFVPTIS